MTKSIAIAALCLAALSGCAGADPQDWCDSHRCEASVSAFDPTPELLGATESAVARLNAATGRSDYRIESGGVPIVVELGLYGPDHDDPAVEAHLCALTINQGPVGGALAPQYIHLDPGGTNCDGPDVVLLHEMIHAIAPAAIHAATGVFSWDMQPTVLNAASLEVVCEASSCPAFNPER